MRAKRSTPRHEEHDEQVIVVKWLNAGHIMHAAIPNAARRSPRQGAWMKAEGMVAGAPDLLIFDPPPLMHGRCGVAIEMKRTKGGRVKPEQERWQRELYCRGWVALVCNGAAEALSELSKLGYQVPG